MVDLDARVVDSALVEQDENIVGESVEIGGDCMVDAVVRAVVEVAGLFTSARVVSDGEAEELVGGSAEVVGSVDNAVDVVVLVRAPKEKKVSVCDIVAALDPEREVELVVATLVVAVPGADVGGDPLEVGVGVVVMPDVDVDTVVAPGVNEVGPAVAGGAHGHIIVEANDVRTPGAVVEDGGSSGGCAVVDARVEVCVQEVVGACARSSRAVV